MEINSWRMQNSRLIHEGFKISDQVWRIKMEMNSCFKIEDSFMEDSKLENNSWRIQNWKLIHKGFKIRDQVWRIKMEMNSCFKIRDSFMED